MWGFSYVAVAATDVNKHTDVCLLDLWATWKEQEGQWKCSNIIGVLN